MTTIFSKPVVLYMAVVAAIYMLILIGGICYVEGISAISLNVLAQMWPFPLVAVGLSVALTAGTILRFGDEGGSVFAIPTIMHCLMIFLVVFSFVAASK